MSNQEGEKPPERYMTPGEDNIWPDEEPPEDAYNQRHANDLNEIIAEFPHIVLGQIREVPSNDIRVKNEILHLPPKLRQTIKKVVRDINGEARLVPASNSEWGGGIQINLLPQSQENVEERTDSKKKSTKERKIFYPDDFQKQPRPQKIHFPEDEFMQQKSKIHKETFRKR